MRNGHAKSMLAIRPARVSPIDESDYQPVERKRAKKSGAPDVETRPNAKTIDRAHKLFYNRADLLTAGACAGYIAKMIEKRGGAMPVRRTEFKGFAAGFICNMLGSVGQQSVRRAGRAWFPVVDLIDELASIEEDRLADEVMEMLGIKEVVQ